jgi:CheY-like chemotaxis protein
MSEERDDVQGIRESLANLPFEERQKLLTEVLHDLGAHSKADRSAEEDKKAIVRESGSVDDAAIKREVVREVAPEEAVVPNGARNSNLANAIKDAIKDLSKEQVLKVVLSLVLVALATTRLLFHDMLSTRMDLVFLSLVLAVFLLWMIPWEELWERLSGFSVGGLGISLQQPDVKAAIVGIDFDEKHLKIMGAASEKEVRDRLQQRLERLEGELQTVRGSRVLWIDDEPHSILGERRLLRALGIDITPATSSKRAKEILEEDHDFDLIITDTLRGSRRRGPREGVDSDSVDSDSVDSDSVDSLQRGTREGVDFIVKLRKGEVTDAPIKDLPVIFYAADAWQTVKNVTSRARNLEPGAEISNRVDDLIPKVIRMLSERRRHPIPVSAKKNHLRGGDFKAGYYGEVWIIPAGSRSTAGASQALNRGCADFREFHTSTKLGE